MNEESRRYIIDFLSSYRSGTAWEICEIIDRLPVQFELVNTAGGGRFTIVISDLESGVDGEQTLFHSISVCPVISEPEAAGESAAAEFVRNFKQFETNCTGPFERARAETARAKEKGVGKPGESRIKVLKSSGDAGAFNSVVLILESKCELKCSFCPAAHYGSSNREPVTEAMKLAAQVKREIPGWREQGVEFISVTGNDPLKHPGFFEIVAMLSANFKNIIVQTANPGIARSSIRSVLEPLQNVKYIIPLYGAGPPVHDRITGVEGCFEETVLLLADESLRLFVNTILLKDNISDLSGMYDLCRGYNRKLDFQVLLLRDQPDIYIANAPRLSQCVSELKRFLPPEEFEAFCSRNSTRIQPCITGVVCHEEISYKMSDSSGKLLDEHTDELNNPDLVRCAHFEVCAAAGQCPGIYQTYIDHYGMSEFEPLK